MTPTISSSMLFLSGFARRLMFVALVLIITFTTSALPTRAADYLVVIRPMLSDAWAIGSKRLILWDVAPGQRGDKKWWNKEAHISLLDVNQQVVMDIGTGSMNAWSFEWTIPDHLQPGTYTIRISVPSVVLEADSGSFKVFQPKVVKLQPTPTTAGDTPATLLDLSKKIQPIPKPVTQVKNLSFDVKEVTYTLRQINYYSVEEVQVVIEAYSDSGFQFGDVMDPKYGFGNVQPLAGIRIETPLRLFTCPPGGGPVEVDYNYKHDEFFALPNVTFWPPQQSLFYKYQNNNRSNNWQYPTAPLPAGKVTFGIILRPFPPPLMPIRTRQPIMNRNNGCYSTFNPSMYVYVELLWKKPPSGANWNPYLDYHFSNRGSTVYISFPTDAAWDERIDNCPMSSCPPDRLGP